MIFSKDLFIGNEADARSVIFSCWTDIVFAGDLCTTEQNLLVFSVSETVDAEVAAECIDGFDADAVQPDYTLKPSWIFLH